MQRRGAEQRHTFCPLPPPLQCPVVWKRFEGVQKEKAGILFFFAGLILLTTILEPNEPSLIL